ncbi:S8 family serine peptidase [Arthrobacter sp. FW305-BF8]|uniref:S8 family serine peptidase n=1 Tax=Arthrobacter sp. FW305-BF8 TaxID=2879617 RepID=UPI001F027F43|nr:S8 family serine peptidase [Arthrobacter sp. FW305-BF8]UKA55504.1 S8 family serine peptidase [Arthrobacter sp. FW305-BF8]
MKNVVIASLAAVVVGLGAITVAVPSNAATEPQQIPGQIIVKFRDSGAAPGLLRQNGVSDGVGIGSTGAHLVKVPAGKESQLIESLNRNPAVQYAEPDQLVTAAVDEPDPDYFPRQYALHNEGQSFTSTNNTVTVAGGTDDADVDAVEAWDVTTGEGIKVAVLDTGVATDNNDIAANVVLRANFSSAATGEDNYGHGTHVAGIIAATKDAAGVSGVCPDCSILDGKVIDDSGSGSTSSIVNGINWAVENGAKVINMSLGQRVPSLALEDAVNNAWNNGVVIVAAAGNAGTQAPMYPAAYPNVIAVAATDNNDAKASFSTYGGWVDVAAPGVDVYSTFPKHPFTIGTQSGREMGYDIASGTSMASPMVAGVAALVWSTPAGTANTSVRATVESTADAAVTGTGTYWAHGRVNACKAVAGVCDQP